MNHLKTFLLIVLLLSARIDTCYTQVENVPVGHPVYTFLKRLAVKGIIERYSDAVLPLSRKDVGGYLSTIKRQEDSLTEAERGWVTDYLSEFRYDVDGTTRGGNSLIESQVGDMTSGFDRFFSDDEKYLYAYRDSNLTLFVNGLLAFDARRISGDALGSQHSEFIQGGGRFRGTIYNHLGYYLQGTNAQFWGSRELLRRDRIISQTHAIRVTDAQNFDISEGYVRYDAGIISAQLGMERALWGRGYDQKMVMSDNVRPFPFIRGDFQYKSLKYTFIHAWLLGRSDSILFTLPSDPLTRFNEPTNADKYIAAHRIEFSFPRLLDVGFQEMMVYSNRSVDLAYLTPLIVLESAQRARGERDNGLWSFDIQTHFLPGLELTGTILFDDLHFGEFFTSRWYNRNGYQLGLFLTDPISLPNTSFMAEWTRVEPFVFAHDRSRDNNYTSFGACLGPRIGPNSDSWFFRTDILPTRNLAISLRVTLVRHGDNIVDATGKLIKNVGGDIAQGHRQTDPLDREFLDGILVKTQKIEVSFTYELVNQMWAEGWFEHERINNTALTSTIRNNTFGARLRMEL